MTFDGVVWRYVPAGSQPLHVGYILLASGRWNRQGEYGCLYTSLTQQGAEAEYRKALSRAELTAEMDQEQDVVSIVVRVARVLDLTDASERARLVVSLSSLAADTDHDIERCRVIADVARASGYQAILSPSAALVDARNLNIYIDGPAAGVHLMEGPQRVPLNYVPFDLRGSASP
jgi:RES domain-containing protein